MTDLPRALKVAALQMNPGQSPRENLDTVLRLADAAETAEAGLVCLPEYVGGLYRKREDVGECLRGTGAPRPEGLF